MELVENYQFPLTTTGTIQMVPGKTRYEPAEQSVVDGNADADIAREARQHDTRLTDEAYETTYNRNRRLTTSATSNIGALIDLYT